MRKIDRLMAILLALLQRRETAQSLADKLEVSKRTILRDMESLAEMGVPLFATAGPGGGFQLMEGFQLPPLQLSSREAMTVLFALQALTQLQDSPFNQERWTVIDKITSILPQDVLQQVGPLLNKLTMQVPRRNYKTPYLEALLEITISSKWIKVFYRSANHERWLQLHPIKVYTAHGFWYCEAYSITHQEERLFRIDRMEQLEVIDSPMVDAHLTSKKISSPNSTLDSCIPIRARLNYKAMLQVEQDEHIGELITAISEDEWEVQFQCRSEDYEWAKQLFFSLGMNAEVIEPTSLRHEIYHQAVELSMRYYNHAFVREDGDV
ncbi:YafY family transcriptional regulator [Paenibacillus albiflavus]|uniref:YafY family transcriptional regulator n=1 Tax=Paenibacillus albiflavus TaxID=2545760 RepID=A0A4R4EE88_9BACL|nr:YafY family protein [Paenibacillus albiflavus]TCZ76335.1 YafY family transcriptional regulator [Paenibacillus albiflavus]